MISKNQVKLYSSLKEKKYRERFNQFLVEGVRLCEELLRSPCTIDSLLCCPALANTSRAEQLVEAFRRQGTSVVEVTENNLRRIADTVQPQGLLAIAKYPAYAAESLLHQAKNICVVDEIQDPGNLGTLLRSAAWFGLDAVLLTRDCVDFLNPKVVRASMGAVFHLPIIEHLESASTGELLASKGFSVYLADVNGETSLYETSFTGKNAIWLGGETTSVVQDVKEIVTTTIKIPSFGPGDSLNVGVAAAIVFSELRRKRSV